jgi:hypothetical protein
MRSTTACKRRARPRRAPTIQIVMPQFAYLNEQTRAFQQRGQPGISVDCKKKELVGDFANGGREWQPAGYPEAVRVHDFLDRQLGKAIPYGVYDVAANQGWVSVGIDHETAAFAVASIRQWWEQMGQVEHVAALVRREPLEYFEDGPQTILSALKPGCGVRLR